jgi:hypothetical protein
VRAATKARCRKRTRGDLVQRFYGISDLCPQLSLRPQQPPAARARDSDVPRRPGDAGDQSTGRMRREEVSSGDRGFLWWLPATASMPMPR